jgi:hypothetical protein
LAQIRTDRWPEVARIWRSGSKIPYLSAGEVVLALGGLVLALAVGLWLAERRRLRRERSHPLALFQRLAVEMDLGWSDRWLLIRMARRQGLPSPLTLLLSPATFEYHARAYAQAQRGARAQRRRGRAARLKMKLFPPAADSHQAAAGWPGSEAAV